MNTKNYKEKVIKVGKKQTCFSSDHDSTNLRFVEVRPNR